jgi:hypothetical protein
MHPARRRLGVPSGLSRQPDGAWYRMRISLNAYDSEWQKNVYE